MYSKKYKELAFNVTNFYPINDSIFNATNLYSTHDPIFNATSFYSINNLIENDPEEKSLLFIYTFLSLFYEEIKKQGVVEFLKKLNENKAIHEYVYEPIQLTIDHQNEIFYLHELTYCRDCACSNDPDLAGSGHSLSSLQACQKKLIDCAMLTQQNFNQIVISWDQLWECASVSFALLYKDESNSYYIKPFQNKELMDQFILLIEQKDYQPLQDLLAK